MSNPIENTLDEMADRMTVAAGDYAAIGRRECIRTAASVIRCMKKTIRDDRAKLSVAVDPVRHWYASDEAATKPPLQDVDIAATAVQDLIQDRDENVAMRALLRSMRDSSGGINAYWIEKIAGILESKP